uniref:dehydrogenase/reductase SDR family member 1-like n=1 Tax=Pristiophorus japonicus TaxID=55135 RepID=UPI00398E8BBC
MAKALIGKVCIVTGASRGIGKGIALQLGEAGATVYITGRNMDTLQAAAKEVEARGGSCVPVVCDSSKEEQVSALFGRVKQEQGGRLDILVNNAYAAVQGILSNHGKRFWELPASVWDDINNVGLRGHYICSVYAAQMMVEAKQGLIVVISSMGGLRYIFSVAYGVGKAAFGNALEDMLRDFFLIGINHNVVLRKLVAAETLDLSKAIAIAQACIETDDKLRQISSKCWSSTASTVHKIVSVVSREAEREIQEAYKRPITRRDRRE